MHNIMSLMDNLIAIENCKNEIKNAPTINSQPTVGKEQFKEFFFSHIVSPLILKLRNNEYLITIL